ncbi:MAG TPA: DUF1127 domain-containing protein [Rubellimicrobium sp.]|jgi:uncharacterized protein YjiS (DUF1127 family)|nr:DUF1127 domain-containing protein [Rubellimicrobium sp.]
MAFAHDTQRAHQGASLAQRFGVLRADLADRVTKYRLYRTTVNELAQLTERELNDLGLSTADIPAVARQAAYKA